MQNSQEMSAAEWTLCLMSLKTTRSKQQEREGRGEATGLAHVSTQYCCQSEDTRVEETAEKFSK